MSNGQQNIGQFSGDMDRNEVEIDLNKFMALLQEKSELKDRIRELEDISNGYNYTCFVNQNFDKDVAGVVTGLSYPEDLNTLFLAAGGDMNVSDIGEANVDTLVGKNVACINYASTGKYKRATWGVLSSLEDTDKLEEKFKAQLAKGYPKNFQSPQETMVEEKFGGRATNNESSSDGMPF